MSHNLLLFVIVILTLFSSCSENKTQEQLLQEKYNSFKKFKESLPSPDLDIPNKAAFRYIDSVARHTANKDFALFAEVYKTHFADYNSDELDKITDTVSAIRQAVFLDEAPPHLKFYISRYLASLYKRQQKSDKLIFDLKFEDLACLESYPDIYHYEIAYTYYYIDAIAGLEFEEHKIGKKANAIAMDLALKYKHIKLAHRCIYNANIQRVTDGKYDEAIKYANMSIDLGAGGEAFNKKYISGAYTTLKKCYLRLAKIDSAQIIDQKYQQLLKEGFFTEDLYVKYLLYSLRYSSVFFSEKEFFKQCDYIEQYLTKNNKQGKFDYELHLLYADMAHYWNDQQDAQRALPYADLSYHYFRSISYQPNLYTIDQIAIFQTIMRGLSAQNSQTEEAIQVLKKIDTLQQIKYAHLQTQSDAYEKQLQLWVGKEKELAESKVMIQKSKTLFWEALSIIVSISSFVLVFLILKLKKRRQELDEVNIALVKQTEIIEEQNAHLEESNINLSHFAATAAHDLKAPLRTISSFSKLLYKRYADKIEPSDKSLFDFVINDCIALKDMIEGLLTYSSVAKMGVKLEVVDIGHSIEMVKNSLSHSIQETNAKLYIQANIPPVMGQETLLKQLFLNLFSNAIKFRKQNETPIINLTFEDTGADEVLISVADNGIGIDEKNHEEIFGIFKKLHPRSEYQGCGIGLSSCKKIVESHGGTIRVSSVLGQGTSFKISLKKAKI